MSSKLRVILKRCAQGPLSYAGQCVMSSRVDEALRELAPSALKGGVERGVAEIARTVGVPVAFVESALPIAALRAAEAELSARHAAAVRAWEQGAAFMGGPLSGITDLTVDGRAPDVALCLVRLANKLARDRHIAEPLFQLSEAVGRWATLVEAACNAVDDPTLGGRLQAAYAKREREKKVKLVAAVVVPTVLALLVGRVLVARVRVDKALDDGAVCAGLELDPADVGRASDTQRARLAEKRAACEAERKAAADKAEADAKAAAKREADAKALAAREASCASLADHLAKGTLDASDRAVAGDAADLLARVAQGRLAADDLGDKQPKLPCADAKAAKRIEEAFGKAIEAGPWSAADTLAEPVKALLIARAEALPAKEKGLFAGRANTAAKKALGTGAPAAIAEASWRCAMTRAMHWPAGVPCTGALSLAGVKTP